VALRRNRLQRYYWSVAVKSLAAVEHGEKPLGQADAPAWVYIPLPTDATALKPVPGFSRCGHQIVTIWLRQATRPLSVRQ
jgi:hypothetical protein